MQALYTKLLYSLVVDDLQYLPGNTITKHYKGIALIVNIVQLYVQTCYSDVGTRGQKLGGLNISVDGETKIQSMVS